MTLRKTLLRNKTLEAARPSEKPYWLWDDRVRGFGCRVHPTGMKAFYLSYRTQTGGTRRRVKLGEFGQLTLAEGRDAARDVLAAVRRGADPAEERRAGRASPTVRDLGERYMREHAMPHKKPSSSRMDQANLRNHVLPALASRKVAEVTHTEIVRLHQKIGSTHTGAANRVLSLVSKMFALAERWGLRSPGTNPAKHVQRFKERKIERYLTAEEYSRLGMAIEACRKDGEIEELAAQAIWLLMFTGLRLSEVTGRKRADVDVERRELILTDSKTGARRVYLNDDALAVAKAALGMRRAPPMSWLFARPTRPAEAINADWLWHRWRKIRTRAGLGDLRIHDLRHALASVAASENYSLLMIGRLLGHRTPTTSARYAHLVSDAAHDAAQTVGSKIRASLGGGTPDLLDVGGPRGDT